MDVLILDEEPIFRAGLKSVLAAAGGVCVMGEASSAREAFSLLERREASLIVLELALPGMDGITTLRELRWRAPGVKAVVLTGRDGVRDVAAVFSLLVSGASNERAAREPCISPKTLATHRQRIYDKLGCHGAVELIRFAVANRLVDIEAAPRGDPAPPSAAPAA